MKAQAQAAIAAPLESHIERYAESHRNPVNKVLHDLGIPLFMVAALGLLSKVGRAPKGPSRPNAAWPVLLGSSLWYLAQDRPVGLMTSTALVAAYSVGSALPSRVLWPLSALAAVAHGVGHYRFEHKPPALLSRPVAVLEAPAWLVASAAGRFR